MIVRRIKDISFYLGMATLFTHELDAMLNHEWRVLPLTSWMAEDTSQQVFIFAHIPLFAGLIALVASKNERVRTTGQIAISSFILFHAFLHLAFKDVPTYEFESITSSILIYGGALFAAVHLILLLINRQMNLSGGSS